MTKIKVLKQELKTLAVEIRSLKSTRKQHSNGYVPGLERSQWIARHKHIAYCLLRGKTMEQIENKNREGNKPHQLLVDQYLKEYSEVTDETVCAG